MLRYIVKRLLQMLPKLILISVITFGISKLAPGDYVTMKLQNNPTVSREAIEREKARLGLDQPVPVQYLKWAKNFVTGDLGESYDYREKVSTLIWQRVPATLLLGVAVFLFVWLIALPLGIFAAVRQYSAVDKVTSSVTFFFLGVPDFFLAMLLLLGAAMLNQHFHGHILPIGGITSTNFTDLSPLGKLLDYAWHLIIPVVAIGIGSIAILQRRMRGNLLDVLGEEYVRTARAKGLPENKVIYKHAVRNALNPMITLLGFEFAALLSGVAIIENIVAWPGLGQLMLDAILKQDVNLAMAGVMTGTIMLLVGNLLADVLLVVSDPRIKLEA
ncbi:MAG: ABC transporter permease [Candidatus Sericytochromatia bacterium]|nr:ABC transporter permease [Candidatus Tanganyikabacteria bacterium]